jgi:hypothetical protein
MEPEQLKTVQANILASDIKPLFADEVLIVAAVKSMDKKERGFVKEGYVGLFFIDMTTMKPVARVVLTPSTAEDFANVLSKNVERLLKDLKSKKPLPKKPKIISGGTGYN